MPNEWPLLLRNGVLNAGTHAIFLRVPLLAA
jgi:hypothetical protein